MWNSPLPHHNCVQPSKQCNTISARQFVNVRYGEVGLALSYLLLCQPIYHRQIRADSRTPRIFSGWLNWPVIHYGGRIFVAPWCSRLVETNFLQFYWLMSYLCSILCIDMCFLPEYSSFTSGVCVSYNASVWHMRTREPVNWEVVNFSPFVSLSFKLKTYDISHITG